MSIEQARREVRQRSQSILKAPGSQWLQQIAAVQGAHERRFKKLEITASRFRAFDGLRPINDLFQRLRVEHDRLDRAERAGWIAHPSMPLIDEELTDEQFSQAMESHYRESWPAVHAGFIENIGACDVSEEAKATFRQGLQAHETDLFRLTSPALFAEIERIARDELHGGALDRIASQRKLREEAGKLTPTDMADSGVQGLRLYQLLEDHLYANVKNEEELAKVRASAVPNRHAAVHGYASYGTFKSSLNALIIAEFVYRTISAVKRAKMPMPDK